MSKRLFLADPPSMSSRLKLQKNTAVKKKAEQQALLAEQESEHALLFDSLKGTDPGTAVVVLAYNALEDDIPSAAPVALNKASRGPEQIKQVLISDSDSAGASDSASAASDFCASEESQQSESDASSMDDDDEDSPPPAKRGKKVTVASTAKASGQRPKVQSSASGLRAASKVAASNSADAKKACSTVRPGNKQAARTSAKRKASSSSDMEETLPIKARPAAGAIAPEATQLATGAITVEHAEQPATHVMAPQDDPRPSTIAAAPEVPAISKQEVAPPKDQKVLHGGKGLPKHMTKGIQIHSPGPAYRAPGLRRGHGGKPLHQIQSQTQ